MFKLHARLIFTFYFLWFCHHNSLYSSFLSISNRSIQTEFVFCCYCCCCPISYFVQCLLVDSKFRHLKTSINVLCTITNHCANIIEQWFNMMIDVVHEQPIDQDDFGSNTLLSLKWPIEGHYGSTRDSNTFIISSIFFVIMKLFYFFLSVNFERG